MPRWIAVKLTIQEHAALRQLAAQTEDTVGAIIREALYVRHGVGEWPPCSSLVAAPACTGVTLGRVG